MDECAERDAAVHGAQRQRVRQGRCLAAPPATLTPAPEVDLQLVVRAEGFRLAGRRVSVGGGGETGVARAAPGLVERPAQHADRQRERGPGRAG